MIQVQDVSKYKKLSQIEHVLARPEMYIGPREPITKNDWLVVDGKVIWKEQTYIPAFDKLFDEVISNSSDHSKRPEGKNLTKIMVVADKMFNCISVMDNGGIPVALHPEYGQYIPEIIFSELLSGSNYDDTEEREGGGKNGLGSKLTNIFSTEFKIETSDGKNRFEMTCSDNLSHKTTPVITPHRVGYTKITFTPDYDKLGMVGGLTDEVLLRIYRRTLEIAASNPHLEVSFNGVIIDIKTYKDFVSMFSDDVIYQDSGKWQVGLIHAGDEGFKQISMVNSIATPEGGTHIDYVVDKLIETVRAYIEKKTKQKVRPAELKSQFNVFINASIINPGFGGQTKEKLSTQPNSYGSRFEFDDKTIKLILNSPMMKKIIAWAERKKESDDMKDAQAEFDKARKSSFHHIEKYSSATLADRSQCTLFLVEGDSAAKPIRAAKDKTQGIFPLKGKPDCVINTSVKALTNQVEFQQLLQIMGLDLSGKIDMEKLRYGTLMVSTDADNDGYHIRGLLIVAFSRFWPELISKGILKFLNTPVLMVTVGKEVLEFFQESEFETWKVKHPNKKVTNVKYVKGLGSHTTENMKRFMNDAKYHVTIDKLDDSDIESLSLAFHPDRADDRKVWLDLH